jgi:hypothetical protein
MDAMPKDSSAGQKRSGEFEALVPFTNDNGSVTVQNSNFLAVPPFFEKTPDCYSLFYRLNLSQDLDVDYDSDSRIVQFEIYTTPSLMPFELEKTDFWRRDPLVAQVIDNEERLKTIVRLEMPEDARLDDSLERKEYDTEVGSLVEVTIYRKKEEDKSRLKSQRFRHMNTMVVTTTKLQHDPQVIRAEIREKEKENEKKKKQAEGERDREREGEGEGEGEG